MIGAAVLLRAATAAAEPGWMSDWLVQEGLSLEVVHEGLLLPTAIAFVPEPSPDPDAARYFIAGLRGKIEVVTNAGTVQPFADLRELGFRFEPTKELPDGEGQGGLASLCLDPQRGYVFATFLHRDEQGLLRNNVIRFATQAKSFALSPDSHVAFSSIFADQISGLAHQIGSCEVHGDQLYVAVGEAWKSYLARNPDAPFGKVLRMTLDGEPIADNPFYDPARAKAVRNYVFALGLRNPFGLTFVGERLFTADNGLGVDRFLEIERGQDYLWDGTDAGIASNASFVWSQSVGPAHVEFIRPDSGLPGAEGSGTFLVAMSASHNNRRYPGVFAIPFDTERRRVTSPPREIVSYRGARWQMVVGLAQTADGVYFSSLDPEGDGGRIYRLTQRRVAPHPYTLEREATPYQLMASRGCLGCHALGDQEYGGGAGPRLTPGKELVDRILARISTAAYTQQVADVDALPDPLHQAWKEQRRAVLGAQGAERVKLWLEYYIQEPMFDRRDPLAMPSLGVQSREAGIMARHLIGVDWHPPTTFWSKLRPPYGQKVLMLWLVLTVLAAGAAFALGSWISRGRVRSRSLRTG
jgi:glucose/arabinose dehydrogenase